MGRTAIVQVLVAASLAGPALAAGPRDIDWQAIPKQSVTLFYPGESTYDWLLSKGHKGARSVRQGKRCVSCHEADEHDLFAVPA